MYPIVVILRKSYVKTIKNMVLINGKIFFIKALILINFRILILCVIIK